MQEFEGPGEGDAVVSKALEEGTPLHSIPSSSSHSSPLEENFSSSWSNGSTDLESPGSGGGGGGGGGGDYGGGVGTEGLWAELNSLLTRQGFAAVMEYEAGSRQVNSLLPSSPLF
jgi:hypothetical protein